MTITPFFPETYDEAIERTQTWLEPVRKMWPRAQWQSVPLYPEEGLAFTWLEGISPHASRALLLTGGLHGIEGYAGIALLDLFINEYLSLIDAATVNLYIVPVINPWGMKHGRRVNPNNVDLNRNFLSDTDFMRDINPEYAQMASFLHPERPLAWYDRYLFYPRLLRCIRECGLETLRNVYPRGQNRFPRGLHYTGQQRQPETQHLVEVLEHIVSQHESLIHLDIHTGFGPKGILNLVFPASEPHTVEELQDILSYPRVVKTATANFYPVVGDLSDHLLHVIAARTSTRTLTFALEYGTIGNQPASLRAMMFENRLYWYGTTSPRTARWVLSEFRKLYYPKTPTWRQKAVAQSREVFQRVVTRLLA